MAMMMTGRVLLVCALCVLWCGAGGRSDGGKTAGSGSGDGSPLESKELETSPQGTQGLHGRETGVKGNVPPASSTPTEEEDDVDEVDSDNDVDEETEAEEGSIEGQSDKGGTAALDPGSGEKNLSGSGQEKNQSIAYTQGISLSDSQESNAISTQPEVEEKNETDENTPAVENALKRVNRESTVPAGGNLPPPPEEGVDSRKKDGEDTTSEDKKMIRRLRPQTHHKATETKAQNGLRKTQKQRQ
ncbi:mucin-associated surface protein (MASP) [Trypanosoma cruzi]|nr:mucin-associated surface protein (MASP) [Trypanosoma cruzi]